MNGETPRVADSLPLAQTHLWWIAILFYGVGDVVTTRIGLGMAGVHEAGPVAGVLLDHYGFLSMVVMKLAVFSGCYLLWKLVPGAHRVGVPLGLAAVGVTVVWWNVLVIAILV